MFRIFLICICASAAIVACGGPPDDAQPEKKIQLEKKAALPQVDGSPFLVKSLPADIKRLDANFDNKALLVGYSINTDTAAPGQMLVVTWYWKSLKPISGQWEYFTHLIDEDGDMMKSVNSQGDMRSKYKPQMWKTGEIIRDIERIPVPDDWKSGTLEFRTGLWAGPTRMPIVKGPVDDSSRARGPLVTISANVPHPIARSNAAIEIPYVEKAPIIDGRVNDAQWESAAVLSRFVDTVTGRITRASTELKLLWDSKNLYVAMTAEDQELLSPYTDSDSPDIWKADALDIFLQPSETGPYFELQANPDGIIYDAYYASYRKADATWNSKAKVATSTTGTLNDTAETDTHWYLEAAIPIAEILPGQLENRSFKGNFFRIDKMTDVTEYSGWSAPMRGDFHAQDRFGKLVLKK
ncbi:MAG: carbohydrate-binding family 9-like protein [Deltaproteobacteria bacterium]|nr:carbohydrate-binding family 9-like protein [Deltaproteobacteria bacterium]